MIQPRISRRNTWARYRKLVMEVLTEAISILMASSELTQNENELNTKLFFCLRDINYTRKLNLLPTYEGQNPPHPDDAKNERRLKKRPDFYWQFVDHSESNSEYCVRYFVLECKRIGTPPRSDWLINKNYILNGVVRFISEEHGYAKGDELGAMVGYVQSMEFESILAEINDTASTVSVPLLVLSKVGWQEDGITYLEHSLDRPFPKTPFTLQHLWVDLRRNYK